MTEDEPQRDGRVEQLLLPAHDERIGIVVVLAPFFRRILEVPLLIPGEIAVVSLRGIERIQPVKLRFGPVLLEDLFEPERELTLDGGAIPGIGAVVSHAVDE